MERYRLLITQQGSAMSAVGTVQDKEIWAGSVSEAIKLAKMEQLSYFLAGDCATLTSHSNVVVWQIKFEQS